MRLTRFSEEGSILTVIYFGKEDGTGGTVLAKIPGQLLQYHVILSP